MTPSTPTPGTTPGNGNPGSTPAESPLLRIEQLSVSFGGGKGQRRVQAADGVSLTVFPGQTLAVVGESGSGKSVSAMSILQIVPTPPGRFDGGKILWNNTPPTQPTVPLKPRAEERRDEAPDHPQASAPSYTDLLTYSEKQMRSVRGNQIAMIFQEPMTSLNPVYTIGDQILEAILLHQNVSREQAIDIAAAALDDVGIADPHARLKEYPHQASGGMRQRFMIAMALACQPRLLLADEPTTALDVTIQAQILELLRNIQREKGMAVMLITHDLGVVAENADVVAVMFAGRIVEYTDVVTLFENPLHPYTRGLLRSMPVLGRHVGRLPTVMDGATIPDHLPPGITVAPHDPTLNPPGGYGGPHAKLHELEPNHWVLCTKQGDAGGAEDPAGTSGGSGETSGGAVPVLPFRRAAAVPV